MAITRVAVWGPVDLTVGEEVDFVPVQAGDRIVAVAPGALALRFNSGVVRRELDANVGAIFDAGVVRVVATSDTVTVVADADCQAMAVVYRGLANTPLQAPFRIVGGISGVRLPIGTWQYPAWSSPDGQVTVVRCAVTPDSTSEPIIVSGSFDGQAGFIAETVEQGPPLNSPNFWLSTFDNAPGDYAGTTAVVLFIDRSVRTQVTDPTNTAAVSSGRYRLDGAFHEVAMVDEDGDGYITDDGDEMILE